MNKNIYDWSEAPEWAQWAATDSDGYVWFYSDMPVKNDLGWDSSGGRAKIFGSLNHIEWESSLEQRPALSHESDPTGRKPTDPGANLGAIEILGKAQQALLDRAASRDRPEGERSMALTVRIFNAATGRDLSESEGWQFMMALKWARANNGNLHNADDAVDLAGFSALWGECEGNCTP